MLSRRVLLVGVAALLGVSPAWAAKAPLSQQELQAQADLIIIGKVESYRTETQPGPDGEERTNVFLEVLVESVEKGKAEVGWALQVRCWKLTRDVGLPTDTGQRKVPAPGSRAKFFVKGESALHPNGIELLDGASELDLPMTSRPVWLPYLVMILLAALALIALTTILVYKKIRANPPASDS